MDRYLVEHFFDPATSTLSYLLFDPSSRACALVDAVLDYQPNTGHTSTASADRLIARVRELNAHVEWILETHVHADHLSAASYLKQAVGGRIGIGAHIREVQATFGRWFAAQPEQPCDGRPFDHLFADGEGFCVGTLPLQVLHTPGHTPACVSYLLNVAQVPLAFVGDTLFSPDYGTARCDFPGADARTLYRSVQRLLSLPDATRLLLCHDYRPGGRELVWQTTVAEQRALNIHVHAGMSEDAFVALRQARDATLAMPTLMLPSVQVNMRAGQLPAADANGLCYLRIPLNQFKDPS
ncbi:MBL fold metallo-hydrolase [Pseudomonas sp. RIT-PI-S]|uniref:MBL fold metallo-hydrolase n=1 Tax=Pseudomonas sp. RIT-PI-S TaxID=3035295 RepID=UPI0021D91DA8|nr:MBL fold metallo-hydrolase [Pseudomonas sp. RIT-PI-S]